MKDILLAPPLSNYDIDGMLVNIKDYRGCFAKDRLPRKLKRKEYTVVNFVEYFDPFGVMPPSEIHEYMKTGGENIRFNDNQLQDTLSVRCGYFLCDYITERAKEKNL